jgi:glycosidase
LPYIKGNDQLDLVFNFDLAGAILDGVFSLNGRRIVEQLNSTVSQFPPSQYGTLLSNHDQNRAMSRLGTLDKARLAALIYLTAPGVPFLYYGEEIGMTGAKPDEQIRSPMQWSAGDNAGFTTGAPWEPVHSDYDWINVDFEDKDPASLLAWYRALVQLRARHPALRVGETLKVVADKPAIYTTLRVSKNEVILVLANLGSSPINDYQLNLEAASLKGIYHGRLLAGAGTVADLATTDKGGFSGYKPISELPARGCFILLLEPVR